MLAKLTLLPLAPFNSVIACRPPGHRAEPRDDIDWVLRECHALAKDALRPETS